jgi:flagellar basal-body rod protein FlgC
LQPGHPLADASGHVWVAAVDPNQEMVEMVETARQYANNVEVLSTARGLALDTLRLGK